MKNLVKKYNMSEIMTNSWVIFRANKGITRSEAMRKAWHIAKNGTSNETFEEVYNNNHKQIFFYINGKVKDSELAEDLTQDTFTKVFKKFHLYDVYKAKLNTWLYRIALNCIVDHIRSKANKNSLMSVSVNQYTDDDNKEFLQLPDNSTNDNTVENNELLDKLGTAFDNLKPKYRQIAEMYFIQELKYKEISEMLNIPMGSVKGDIARARKMLQGQLINEKV